MTRCLPRETTRLPCGCGFRGQRAPQIGCRVRGWRGRCGVGAGEVDMMNSIARIDPIGIPLDPGRHPERASKDFVWIKPKPLLNAQFSHMNRTRTEICLFFFSEAKRKTGGEKFPCRGEGV